MRRFTSALSEALEQQTATAELQQARTRELAEAHEQQTATAEILHVISSSPTDIQPVFAAVLKSAARLCDAFDASIFQVDGDQLRLVAHDGPIPTIPLGEFPFEERPWDVRCSTGGRSMSPICRPRSTTTLNWSTKRSRHRSVSVTA
jgi:hypothetical protein